MESTRQNEITVADLEHHSRRHGKKATSQLLAVLGRKRPLYDIVMSPGGQVLFSYLISDLDSLLDKIIDNKASEEDRLKYKVSVDFLRHATTIMKDYKRYSDKLKGVK